MFLSAIEITGGLILLVMGADRFVTGAAKTSRLLGIPPLIVGLTIVGMATSVPEILVGSVAALEGKTHIAVGNAIGSNIANISLVLGGTATCRAFSAKSTTLGREFWVMMLALLLGLAVMLDQHLGRVDAAVLLAGLAVFLSWTVYTAKHTRKTDPLIREIQEQIPEAGSAGKSVMLLIGGLAILFLGAEILVSGAVEVAKAFGISDLVIGLTVIAVGTSLPELAASMMSVFKNEADLAIGNIIGSNIFNILAVLGIPVLIHPDSFESQVLTRDMTIMFALSLILGWIIYYHKTFNRAHGLLLLCAFLGYQSWLLASSPT